MLAEVLIVPGLGVVDRQQPPALVAYDGRVEYCKPQVSFLQDGRLLARLNLVTEHMEVDSWKQYQITASHPDVNAAIPPRVLHGLYILERCPDTWFTPVAVMGLGSGLVYQGHYDVCSNSYGGERNMGVKEGFVLNLDRSKVAVTARLHTSQALTMTDEIWIVDFTSQTTRPATWGAAGCHVPVCFSTDDILVFHRRSPVEWGDLYLSAEQQEQPAVRLTQTMPMGLKAKLSLPKEVCIELDWKGRECKDRKIHALIYAPLGLSTGEIKLSDIQPLVWAHGGPMCVISFDFNPLFNWLASLGYLVIVPNFRGRSQLKPKFALSYFACLFLGSIGFGVEWMDSVLRDGCGVADLEDCFSAAEYLKKINTDASFRAKIRFHEEDDTKLDLQRGVGVAGHSWGGYLALMCMVHPFGPPHPAPTWTSRYPPLDGSEHRHWVVAGENKTLVFTCGVAAAGIADWFVQQRGTDVRYYDFAIMGGWVYEADVAARVQRASPLTHAEQLRAPLLIMHGEDDVDVPFAQIQPFAAAAKKSPHLRASVDFVTYPGEGHGISGTVAQKDVLQRTKDFLRINLKPWNFTDNPHGDTATY